MSTPRNPAGPSGKRYSAAFKQDALALIAAGRSVSQVSADLGVSIWTLGGWKKVAEAASSPKAAPAVPIPADTQALAAEVVRLRKALERSELHTDIFKKALAIVGQTPPPASS